MQAGMGSLAGRRIVITGIAGGVGFETAKLFLAEGAELLGVGRDEARLADLRRRLGVHDQQMTTLAGDLRSPELPAALRQAVERRWGALDILMNNAGVQVDGEARGLCDGTPGAFDESMAVNLLVPYRLSLALVPLLRKGREPRIMNVSSGAGTFQDMRLPNIASYRLSKWALNGLTMLMATELTGVIAVNAFDPGWVKTPIGGPKAPGQPAESARGALHLAALPFTETGKFWKDGAEIPF
jgi:NAD(P)-dependent dehydrogenase (short-subunit alcohol dehydrogenase family)